MTNQVVLQIGESQSWGGIHIHWSWCGQQDDTRERQEHCQWVNSPGNQHDAEDNEIETSINESVMGSNKLEHILIK